MAAPFVIEVIVWRLNIHMKKASFISAERDFFFHDSTQYTS